MKQEIFSAAEARKKTYKVDYDTLTHDMVKYCMKQIDQFAQRGFWSCDVDIWTRKIREPVAKELKSLDYQVEQIWCGLRISWRED